MARFQSSEASFILQMVPLFKLNTGTSTELQSGERGGKVAVRLSNTQVHPFSHILTAEVFGSTSK